MESIFLAKNRFFDLKYSWKKLPINELKAIKRIEVGVETFSLILSEKERKVY